MAVQKFYSELEWTVMVVPFEMNDFFSLAVTKRALSYPSVIEATNCNRNVRICIGPSILLIACLRGAIQGKSDLYCSFLL